MAEWTSGGLTHKIGDYRVSPDGLRVGVGIGPYDVMPSRSKAEARAAGQEQPAPARECAPSEHYSSSDAEAIEEKMYRGEQKTRRRWEAEKAERSRNVEPPSEPKKGFFSRLLGL